MSLHDIYLPFSESILKKHFIEISKYDRSNLDQHINYFKKSIANYRTYENNSHEISISDWIKFRQIEKDEKFWTVSTFLTLFHSKNRISELSKLLKLTYGKTPPLPNFNSWSKCLTGDLYLFFEPNLPSPKSYLNWLKSNIENNHLIPYIVEKAKNKTGEFRANLEGATNVDALFLNATNGFALVVEAKVLSDKSCQVFYDLQRNQLIRNIDVMLESNAGLRNPLDKRNPDKSLFLLVSPHKFKTTPHSRFYGFKYHEYKKNPSTISIELPHRNLDNEESSKLSRRIGWVSWEELNQINRECCNWL